MKTVCPDILLLIWCICASNLRDLLVVYLRVLSVINNAMTATLFVSTEASKAALCLANYLGVKLVLGSPTVRRYLFVMVVYAGID